MSDDNRGQGPLQTFRDGAVCVKLWRQDSPESGPFVSATVGRTYRDPVTGDYRESRSLGGTDMLKAQALLGEAHREALRWREHFREAGREAAAQLPLPETEAVPEPSRPSLAEQRDAALANAAPVPTGRGRERPRER